MLHPECGSKAVKIGRNRSGTQRYKCKTCGQSFSDSDRAVGRPKISDLPLTPAQRTQRSRAKLQSLISVTKSLYNWDANLRKATEND